ncbi:hypothetical protein [Mesobacillus thioparans]|uniref:hypothetical protein n=1 Tax=Mesobacillus thioparans TaxID=370439 RepID=UPI0039EEDC7B
MIYEVSIIQSIDYGATGVDAILQNVRFIMSTIKNSCVMDREFGLSQDVIDAPIPLAQSLLASEYIFAIESREPRVTVEQVEFEENPIEGILIPRVKVVVISDEV